MSVNFGNFDTISVANRGLFRPDASILQKSDGTLTARPGSKTFVGKVVNWFRATFDTNGDNRRVRKAFQDFLVEKHGKSVGRDIYKRTCYSFFSLRARPLTKMKIQKAMLESVPVAEAERAKRLDPAKGLRFMSDVVALFERDSQLEKRDRQFVNSKGVFRIPGNVTNVKLLTGYLPQVSDLPQVPDREAVKANDLASSFKWLAIHGRSSEDRQFYQVFKEWLTCLSEGGDESAVLAKLPPLDQMDDADKLALKMASMVIENREANLMPRENIGMCFSKVLLGAGNQHSKTVIESAGPFFSAKLLEHYLNQGRDGQDTESGQSIPFAELADGSANSEVPFAESISFGPQALSDTGQSARLERRTRILSGRFAEGYYGSRTREFVSTMATFRNSLLDAVPVAAPARQPVVESVLIDEMDPDLAILEQFNNGRGNVDETERMIRNGE